MTTESARRRAFMLASRPLAEALVVRPPALQLHPDLAAGVLEEDDNVASLSRPLYRYRMVRTASGWQHTSTDCQGWLIRGTCHHTQEKDGMTTALVPTNFEMAVFDAAEDDEITGALAGHVEKSWIYQFPQGGSTITGISAIGVEQASSEMARHGEGLRVLDIKVEFEDEKEARFLVQAGRFAISADGREQLMDTTIRAKRQMKTIKLRNGGVQEDEHWYEKGVTKAVRNAKLALMPEYARSYIISQAVKAGRARQVQPAAEARQIERPANVDADGVIQPEKASPAEVAKLMSIWRNTEKGSDPAAKLRARFPKAFPLPGTGGVPTPNVLSAAEVEEALAILSAKAACEHEADDGATGVLRCVKCQVALEGPDTEEQPTLGV